MKRLIALFLLFCAPLAMAQEQSLPAPPDPVDELAPLRALIDDEERVIEALRQFHLAQETLFQMDLEMAQSYSEAGDAATAQIKVEQANQRIDLVRKAYEIVLESYPQNAQALNYYGEVLYDHYKEFAKAVQHWRLAASLDDKLAPPRNNLALHYFHNGDYELGFRYMDQAMKLDPNNPDYLFNLAQIYLIHWPEVQERREWPKEKVYKEAMQMSRKAAELLPNDYQLQEDYAVNFFAAENFEVEANWSDAAKAWQKARAQARTEDDIFYTWLNEARVWARAPNWEKAEECLTQALAIYPDSTAANNLLQSVQAREDEGA